MQSTFDLGKIFGSKRANNLWGVALWEQENSTGNHNE